MTASTSEWETLEARLTLRGTAGYHESLAALASLRTRYERQAQELEELRRIAVPDGAFQEMAEFVGGLRAKVEKQEAVLRDSREDWLRREAVIEAARTWCYLDDKWFAVSDARPFDAEVAALASMKKRNAAVVLRDALAALGDNEKPRHTEVACSDEVCYCGAVEYLADRDNEKGTG